MEASDTSFEVVGVEEAVKDKVAEVEVIELPPCLE